MALTKEQLSEIYHADALSDLMVRQSEAINPEATICARFGCGRRLTPQEALYGQHCPDHQPKVQVDCAADVPELVSY